MLKQTVSHIRNTTASFNSDIIGPGAEDMLNKSFHDAKSFVFPSPPPFPPNVVQLKLI